LEIHFWPRPQVCCTRQENSEALLVSEQRRSESNATSLGAHFKDLVLFSRMLAILALGVELSGKVNAGEGNPDLLLPLSLIVCSLIWASADWMLLSCDSSILRMQAKILALRVTV
jgi:hypothetical protein